MSLHVVGSHAILPAMSKRARVIGIGALVASLVAAACAVGQDGDAVGDLVPSSRDGGDPDSATSPASTIDPTEDEDSGSEPTEPGDSGTDGGDGGTGDGGTVPPGCGAVNSCKTALELDAISADTGSDVQTTQGRTSKWIKIPALDKFTLFNDTESVTVDLTSPQGDNYDLYVYLPDSSTADACGFSAKSSKKTSGTDSVTVTWPDVSGSNDDRTLAIEVRYVSGACPSANNWTLKVSGNTQ